MANENPFRASTKKVFDGIRERISNNVQRKLALAIYAELTNVTPVDTGRARSSWRLTEGFIDPSTEEGEGPFVPKPPNLPSDDGRLNKVYFITNNLPYINPLNDGHSTQAGQFFVQQAVKFATKQVKV